MPQLAIRGAITVEANTADAIKAASIELASKLIQDNNLDTAEMVTIFITMTSDLTAYNASAAIRTGLGLADIAFFTSQEAEVDGMLPRCIRLLVHCESNKSKNEIKHIYLGEAAKLRPDLQSQ